MPVYFVRKRLTGRSYPKWLAYFSLKAKAKKQPQVYNRLKWKVQHLAIGYALSVKVVHRVC